MPSVLKVEELVSVVQPAVAERPEALICSTFFTSKELTTGLNW